MLLYNTNMNITCLLKGHSWNHCTCTRCGKTRDEQHVVDHCEEKCSICGQIIHHDWVKKYEETIGPNEYGCVENITIKMYECRNCSKLRKEVQRDFHKTEWDAEITEEDRRRV